MTYITNLLPQAELDQIPDLGDKEVKFLLKGMIKLPLEKQKEILKSLLSRRKLRL